MTVSEEHNDGFDWNAELPPPKEFELMPEGDAEFEVLKLERTRKEMGKLGTVNVAIVTLMVKSLVDPKADSKTIEDKLSLHPKTVFKLYQFFASIGQYNHGAVENGKPFTPNWAKIVGKGGYCVLEHNKWIGRDKKEHVNEQVSAYLDSKGRQRASDEPREVGAPQDNLKF
jgi:hypothetical protein